MSTRTPPAWPSLADCALELALHAPQGRVKADLAMAAVHLTGLSDPAFAVGFLPEQVATLLQDIEALWAASRADGQSNISARYAADHVSDALSRITPPVAQPLASGAHLPAPSGAGLPVSAV